MEKMPRQTLAQVALAVLGDYMADSEDLAVKKFLLMLSFIDARLSKQPSAAYLSARASSKALEDVIPPERFTLSKVPHHEFRLHKAISNLAPSLASRLLISDLLDGEKLAAML
jgi:hypothetical protein